MKLLPIEEGCRAMIINSVAGNNGIDVIVGQYIGNVYGWIGKDRWWIDRTVFGVFGTPCNHMLESQLMRIDGNEDLFKSEEDNKTLELVK